MAKKVKDAVTWPKVALVIVMLITSVLASQGIITEEQAEGIEELAWAIAEQAVLNYLEPQINPSIYVTARDYNFVVIDVEDYAVLFNGSSNKILSWAQNDDGVVLNDCLGNLTSGRTWYERVAFIGNFTVSETLVPGSYTEIYIFGVLKAEDNLNDAVIERTTAGEHIKIFNGEIDGNLAGQTTIDVGRGIELQNVDDVTIENVWIHHTKGEAVRLRDGERAQLDYMADNSEGSLLTLYNFEDAQGKVNGHTTTDDPMFQLLEGTQNCILDLTGEGGSEDGLTIDGEQTDVTKGNQITAVIKDVEDNGLEFLSYASENSITITVEDPADYGAYFEALGDNNSLSDSTFNGWDSIQDGVYMAGAGNRLINNKIYNFTASGKYGINDQTADENIFINNDLSDNDNPSYLTSVTSVWHNNIGDPREQGGKYTHIVKSAPEYEIVIEELPNVGVANILCNWDGTSVASAVIPAGAAGLDITIEGLGRDKTILKGRIHEDPIESTLSSWVANDNHLRIKHITIESNSSMALNGRFFNTYIQDVEFGIRADAGSKGILIGGAGAPGNPSTWQDYTIKIYSGVTTNMVMRIWYECFVSIDASIVIQSSPYQEIGYIYEMFGTSSTFIKTNFHHWQKQNVTGAYWYLNGHGHFCQIYGIYAAESGGTATTVNSYFRIGEGYTSYFSVDGTVGCLEPEGITKIFYDEYSGNHTDWKATWVTSDAYSTDPPPKSITIKLVDQITSTRAFGPTQGLGTSWASYTNFNNYTLDLTGYLKCMIIGRATGSAGAGIQGLAVWDITNDQPMASYTWTGNAITYFQNQTIIQDITGDILFGWYGKHDTGGTIYTANIVVVFW